MQKCVCIILGGMLAASAASANLLTNPGFETEGPGGSWYAAGWTNESDIGRTDWAGNGSSYGIAGYGDADDKWGYICQTVANAYDETKPVYEFNIWGMAEENFSSSGSEVYMKLTFKQDGSELGSFQQNIYSDFIMDTDWHQYTMTVTNSDWSSANQVEALFGFGQTVNDPAGDCGLRVDDASLTQIPEPSSVLLLALGIAGLTVVRQRNK
jgi:hypothetical protein